ncbi:hypothetical protein NEOKW01_0311 [Nematocida sp. AWRm80]|nr:hypothetical protein NEOKW01_0311 [Nematocida sp. AWRm80]
MKYKAITVLFIYLYQCTSPHWDTPEYTDSFSYNRNNSLDQIYLSSYDINDHNAENDITNSGIDQNTSIPSSKIDNGKIGRKRPANTDIIEDEVSCKLSSINKDMAKFTSHNILQSDISLIPALDINTDSRDLNVIINPGICRDSANRLIMCANRNINDLSDYINNQQYALCVEWRSNDNGASITIGNLNSICSLYNKIVLWRYIDFIYSNGNKESNQLTNNITSRVPNQNSREIKEDSWPAQALNCSNLINLSIPEEYRALNWFISNDFSICSLIDLKCLLTNKDALVFYISTHNNKNNAFFELLSTYTTIRYISIVCKRNYAITPGYISFSQKPSNKTLLLRNIDHLSIIAPICYSLFISKPFDIIQLVKENLCISFTVWLSLLNDCQECLSECSSKVVKKQREKMIPAIKMSIYPIIPDYCLDSNVARYTYNAFINSSIAKGSSFQRQYASILYSFMEDNIYALSSGAIFNLLTNQFIIYTNLTELTFYVYLFELDEAFETLIQTCQSLGWFKNSKTFPALKKIIMIPIPDTYDHLEFGYNYESAALIDQIATIHLNIPTFNAPYTRSTTNPMMNYY